MAIEFEPEQWVSRCERFAIKKWEVNYFVAFDREQFAGNERRSSGMPTFADAVRWCEIRAKQQGQGGGA